MSALEFAAGASYLGSAGLLYLETGALFGVVVPGGDSLVLALGVLAATETLDVYLLWPLLCAAVVLGQWSGYYLGARGGRKILGRMKPAHLARARYFLRRYGRAAILLAPFVPVVRTLVPFLAGAGGVPARHYMVWSAASAFVWVSSVLAVGYLATGWVLEFLH